VTDEELARRYAPIVVIHPSERFAPMPPDIFLHESRLIWREEDGDALERAPVGGIDAAWLGAGRAARREENPYLSPTGAFAPFDFTRPFDESTLRGRPQHELARSAGFAILHPDEAPGRVATAAGLRAWIARAPVFWEIRRGPLTLICYWLFSGSSTYPLGWADPAEWLRRLVGRSLGAELAVGRASRAPAPGPRADIGDLRRLRRTKVVHQGDWEGLTVVAGQDDEPVSVQFRAHGQDPPPLPWATVESRGGRPVAYCGQGSHATYEGPKSPTAAHFRDFVAEKGPEWDVLAGTGGLRPVRDEPWYGFGGAWGDPDLDDHWMSLDVARSDFTGPLGPSGYKAIISGKTAPAEPRW
jgi:hypothetical protein